MINLHLHTNCSDGTLSPIDLLKELESNNIKIAAITDHDNIDAHFILSTFNIKKYFTGKLFLGVEMKCNHNNVPIEILAYNFDARILNPYLVSNRLKIVNFQKESFAQAMDVCKKLNLKHDEYILKSGEWAGSTLFKLLLKYYDDNIKILGKDILANSSLFYRYTFCNQNSPFFISEERIAIPAKEVVLKIKEADGISSIAHIGQYKTVENKIAFLEDLYQDTNVNGIECYYDTHTPEETKKYIEFCHKYNLLISGGSDFHGTDVQNSLTQDNIDPNELKWLTNIKKSQIKTLKKAY